MIILDTNIISELMRNAPSPKVIHWIDKQDVTKLFITAVTIAEIAYGISVLPKGNRQSVLKNAFDKVIHEAFKHRILFF